MRVILDIMGGDNPPEEFVKGAVLAKSKFRTNITLVGNERIIRETLKKISVPEKWFEIVHADDVVTMEDDPMSITGAHASSSMAKALKMIADGHGDAVVSAGNTGALFTGATLICRRIRGVRRAALAMIMPYKTPTLLLDCGANVTVTPEYLVQFAYLGSVYMERVMGVENPRVALLNNGTEAHKGTTLAQEAYKMLSEAESINFVGNIEGKDAMSGTCDVIVTDGFTGNILLKTCEGMSRFVLEKLHEKIFGGVRGKLSEMLKRRDVGMFFKMFDAKEYGGAPFLGISKPVIKAHGSSDKVAVCAAIGQAIKCVEMGVTEQISACSDKFAKYNPVRHIKTEQTENTQ